MEKSFIETKMIELANSINYNYNNLCYLKEAMHCKIVHKYGDGKNRKNYTNDRYATLGDAILKFILSEYLFDKGCDKAEITERKQKIENNDLLFDLCNKSGIFEYAYNDISFFNDAPQENQVSHSIHDVYIEEIIAAIYKDKGFDYCKKWVVAFFKKHNILFD